MKHEAYIPCRRKWHRSRDSASKLRRPAESDVPCSSPAPPSTARRTASSQTPGSRIYQTPNTKRQNIKDYILIMFVIRANKPTNQQVNKLWDAHGVCQHLESHLTRVEHAALCRVLLLLHKLSHLGPSLHKSANNLPKATQQTQVNHNADA